jgi:hypothetical protein
LPLWTGKPNIHETKTDNQTSSNVIQPINIFKAEKLSAPHSSEKHWVQIEFFGSMFKYWSYSMTSRKTSTTHCSLSIREKQRTREHHRNKVCLTLFVKQALFGVFYASHSRRYCFQLAPTLATCAISPFFTLQIVIFCIDKAHCKDENSFFASLLHLSVSTSDRCVSRWLVEKCMEW